MATDIQYNSSFDVITISQNVSKKTTPKEIFVSVYFHKVNCSLK
jgi:hypothetical protein